MVYNEVTKQPEKKGRKCTNIHRASQKVFSLRRVDSNNSPTQRWIFFPARVVKCNCTRIKLILPSRHKTQEMRRVTTSWPTPSSVPHRSPMTVFIKLRSKPLTTTEEEEEEEEEEPVWRPPASPFMCFFNGAAISPHLLLSRWADRYGTTCIYTPPGRLRRSLCSPPVLSSASSFSLSICLVNMCKQTSRGIDKNYPGVFISASSGQKNITPPPLKMISLVVFFFKCDLGDHLPPPSRVHSFYLVSLPFFPSTPSYPSSLHLSHSFIFPLPSFSFSTLLFPSASPPPLIFSHLFLPSIIFLPHLLHFISTLFLLPPSFPCFHVSL